MGAITELPKKKQLIFVPEVGLAGKSACERVLATDILFAVSSSEGVVGPEVAVDPDSSATTASQTEGLESI